MRSECTQKSRSVFHGSIALRCYSSSWHCETSALAARACVPGSAQFSSGCHGLSSTHERTRARTAAFSHSIAWPRAMQPMQLAHVGGRAPVRVGEMRLRRMTGRPAARGSLRVFARCSGAVGRSATGIGRSDLQPPDSDRTGWTVSAQAVPPPAPAPPALPREQNRFLLPAAVMAAAVRTF